MNVFKRLKELFSESIESCKYRINSIDRKSHGYDELKKIIEQVNNQKNLYLSQVKRIGIYYPEFQDYISLLEEIETMILSIKNGFYNEVLPDRIRVILTKTDIPSEDVISTMNDFLVCEKLSNYVEQADPYDPVRNIVMKAHQNLYSRLYDSFQYFFSLLINELQECFRKKQVDSILLAQRKELEDYLERITRINSLFDERGMIHDFESDEDFELFYSWIKGKLPINLEQELLQDIMDYQNNNKSKEDIIEENRKKTIELIKKITHDRQQKLFSKVALDNLPEEDKKIILKVKDIYLEMCEKCHRRFYFTSSELGDRKDSYYQTQEDVEWGIVLADIESNLIPNINNDYESVIKIFKYIIEVYVKGQKQEKLLLYQKKKITAIDLFIHDLKELLKIDDLYDTRYDYLFDDGVDNNDERYGGQYDYYAIRYFLRKEVIPFIEELESEILRLADEVNTGRIDDGGNVLYIEVLRKRFDILLHKYQEKLDRYNEYRRRTFEEKKVLEDGERKENLVFCLEEIDLSDSFGKYDEGKRNELEEAVISLESRRFDDLKRPSGRKSISEILYRPSTKNKRRKGQMQQSMERFNNPYFTAYRYSGSGNYRTGFIHFPICAENKIKLKEMYNLEDEFAIFAVFKVISSVGINHDEYQDFVDYIRANMSYLESIGQMFLNPLVDIKKICKIIDDGIVLQEELIKEKKY